MTTISDFFKAIPNFFYWSVLSGILVGTSYIPFQGWFLFVCYIPLWVAALGLHDKAGEKNSFLKIFLAGWITQFILTLIGFNWIFYVATEFGQLHWSLATGALLLFAGLMHLYIPLSLVLGSFLLRRYKIRAPLPRFLILALTLALLERIWPSIFEWNLAYSLLWMKFPLFQLADTVGFWGLSTWLLLLQAVFAAGLYERRARNKTKAVMLITTALGTLLLLAAIGAHKGREWARTDEVVHIAVAQGNIANAEKMQSEQGTHYHPHIRGIYTDLTSRLLETAPQTELMIWPETAMPFALDEFFLRRTEQTALLESVHNWGFPLITGGYSVDTKRTDHLGYPITRNAVFYFSPERKLADVPYFKTNLLVFGEYMPFGKEFPFLYKLLPFVGVYEKGPGPVVATLTLKNKTLKVGPQICYDSLAPGFSRGLALNGAQVIFNVTNDAWYGPWAEPFQHQLMTLARAVEVRRPMVRATNTGVSSAILASGAMLENSPQDKPWAHTYEIHYNKTPEQTFYTRIGYLDWIVWLLALLSLIFFGQTKNKSEGN